MVFLITAGIIILYAWKYITPEIPIDERLILSLPAVILAGVTALICLIGYFWIPKKLITPVIMAIYGLLGSLAALAIIETGGVTSPFIVLWILVGLFSAALGFVGWLPLLLAAGVFMAIHYLNREMSTTDLIVITSATLLPIAISAIIYRSRPSKDEAEDSSIDYHNLANELSEVASKSEVVINAIGDGVVAIDSQGIIQLINPAAQSIIGWGKQDALALNYRSVLKLVNQKDEPLDETSDPIRQALNSNQEVRTNNLMLMTSSGKKLMVSLVVSPVGDVGSGVITVFRDVTKEKAEEREQAEFISTASHEMRTPVASIEGYLGLALNPQTSTVDDRAREFIQKAQAATQHLGRLFQDLLDVAKSEDGRVSNNPKVVNLVAFVHDIVLGLKPKADEKGLQLSFKPIPDGDNERLIAPVYSVNLDNDHIREIVNNLVENAIKYTASGEVIVDINGDDDHVVVSVQDTGVGIPKEDIQHLFQKFYRVENKDTQEIGGTGLGLYLSRRLAELMGGRIWVESEYQKGSTFFLELPRISSQDASRLAQEQATQAAVEARKLAEQSAVTSTTVPASGITTVVTPTPAINNAPPVQQVIEPVLNKVPRGQALTPEQIAAYVAKQRALAQAQQTAAPPAAAPMPTPVNNLPRPQSLSVPQRVIQ